MLGVLVSKYKKYELKKKWRSKNPHNTTQIIGQCNIDLIHVGKYTYGGINALTFNTNNKLIIGSFCSIGPNVVFVVSADHELTHISTFPFKVKCLAEPCEGTSKGDIIIEDDVWIGYHATVMSGVHIAQGAVIAAGAIVTQDVPPYAVVGGSPAKVIKYRFCDDVIQELLKVDYSKIDKKMIERHIEDLYVELTDIEQFEWMPKK